jgi:hypothetical protein
MVITDIRPIESGPVPCQNRAMSRQTPNPRLRGQRRAAARSAVAIAAIALTLAACGQANQPTPSLTPTSSSSAATSQPSPSARASTSPSAAPSPLSSAELASLYQTIEDQVVTIRQLQPKSPVAPTLLDDAGIKKLTRDQFDKDNPPALVDANQRMYQVLGMLPPDASLHDLYVELLGSQVAGLYSPDDKHLYVVTRSGAVGPAEKVTFSHEFTHALQDQNFDLGALKLDEIGQGDRSLGRLSLVEGDATLVMTLWQGQNLTPAENAQMLAESTNDPSTAQLLAMPPILRESLLFPYLQGVSFVNGLFLQDGWTAVNDAFSHPPASTEQILHPAKYTTHEAPLVTTLPGDLAARLGAGWKSSLEDTFGEFQLQVWLRQNATLGGGGANDAAAGWGGDRIEVLDGPNGAWGVVLRTRWDSAGDAAAFETAATPIVDGLAAPASILPGAGGTERWVVVASDDATLARLSNVLGLAG